MENETENENVSVFVLPIPYCMGSPQDPCRLWIVSAEKFEVVISNVLNRCGPGRAQSSMWTLQMTCQ
jgi:hypothetical protein